MHNKWHFKYKFWFTVLYYSYFSILLYLNLWISYKEWLKCNITTHDVYLRNKLWQQWLKLQPQQDCVVVNVIISVSPYYVFRACRHVSDINLISELPCYVHPLNATEEAWSFRRTLSNSPFICGSFCIPQYFLVFHNILYNRNKRIIICFKYKMRRCPHSEKKTQTDFVHDWVAQTSIKFKSQLNLKCKLISCTVQANLSVT